MSLLFYGCVDIEQKSEVDNIDGTPKKRLFWSIISDYNAMMALLELVDNAIDMATKSKCLATLSIDLTLDVDRQIVSVSDNAGGITKTNLPLLITPGGSSHDPTENVIGVFGVGSKRASVALGEQIEIRTRFGSESTHQLDITREWLDTDSWNIPVYRVPDIAKSTTCVEITRLRKRLDVQDLAFVREKIAETYGNYFDLGVKITLNGTNIESKKFNVWAYPPEHSPTSAQIEIEVHPYGTLLATITGGLIRDRNPEARNYGVYFYCNDRLIEKEVRSRDAGYNISGEAGVPHPDISLSRVIVELHGPAGAMPWNSSKSSVSFEHSALQEIRPTIVSLTSRYSKVSRSLKQTWDKTVTPFNEGTIKEVSPQEMGKSKKFTFLPLAKQRQNYFDKILKENREVIDEAPWLRGIVEAMGFADLVSKKRVSTRNRVALILLDSNFEISLKEFIVHRKGLFPRGEYDDIKLLNIFKNRSDVILHVSRKICIPDDLIIKAEHYYNLRNKLIHERATVDISDEDIAVYKSVVSEFLNILHDLEV